MSTGRVVFRGLGLGPGDARGRSVIEGAPPMIDLWIIALTAGLFGAAAGFVRLCEKM
jgi:hypothetical protein